MDVKSKFSKVFPKIMEGIGAILGLTFMLLIPGILIKGCVESENRKFEKRYQAVLQDAQDFLRPSDGVVVIKTIRVSNYRAYYFIESPVTKKNRTAEIYFSAKDKPVEEGSYWVVEPYIANRTEQNFKFLRKVDPIQNLLNRKVDAEEIIGELK